MNIVKSYGDYICHVMKKNPRKAGRLITAGLRLYSWSIRHFPNKNMPKAYQDLNCMALSDVAEALDHPETMAFTNIFAPVEILQCFGYSCVSTECLSSFLSGFYVEDRMLDFAESEGIAPTLCSYHRGFIGAVDQGILPLPAVAVTTSMVCDANVNTFRYISDRYSVPSFVIDIPHEDSPEAEDYVISQYEELVSFLEKETGRSFDIDMLRERIRTENSAKRHYLSFVKKRKHHIFPSTLTLNIMQLYASHLVAGTKKAEDIFRKMDEEVDSYPDTDEKKILWLHVSPYAQPTLQSYFNYGYRISMMCDDFNLDYTEMMDESDPLRALARKCIRNIYNGDCSRKIAKIDEYIDEFEPDAVIQFCSWGCRQSSGSVQLMKDHMKERGMPMLILDGDAIDRRNCPDGQIKTRMEAFMEMLEA